MEFGAIYAVHSNTAKTIVYVGQTRADPHKRWAEHAKGKTPFAKLLRLFGVDDFRFVVLEQVPVDRLNAAERYWIAKCGTLAPKGMNCTEGGNAGRKAPTSRARMSAAKRKQWSDPGYKDRVSAALTAAWQSDERRAAASDATRAMMANADARNAISEANTGRKRSDETRAKLAETNRAKWLDPEYRARQVAARTGRKTSEETRAKQSEAAKARYRKEKTNVVGA